MKLNHHLPLAALVAAIFLTSSFTEARAENPPPVCNRVRFQPTAGGGKDMVGGKIEGSNVSRTEGFVTLAEIKEAPTAKDWGELKFENSKVYRYLRCMLPREGQGKLGKVEFYDGDRLIAGDKDGILVHYFLPDAQDERTVGYDLLNAAAQRPAIKPDNGEPDGPIDVTINSTRGAVIRYTLDGTWPTMEHGETYTAPVHIDKTTTISAVAILPDRAPSLLATMTYLLPNSRQPGLNTAHLGNSLTQTTGGFWRFARTAGYDQKSSIFARPGALTRELWAVASGDYKADKVATAKEDQALKRGQASWADYFDKIGKIDLLTMQPRDFDLDKEIAAEVNFLKVFRQKSPDLQPYLYCEWVEMARQRPSDKGEVPSFQMKKTFPALTWEESMGAMLLYVEELQQRLGVAYPEGKRAHVIPTALAMGWIKNMIDHGKFGNAKPGSFYPLLFNDQVHPADAPIHGTANGAFLVDMTWYSTFYREPSEGKVLPIETNLTPEQVRLVEQLAWNVIKNYPDCGLFEEGKMPCGKPEFANDGKIITLKSATPGAWFRYTLDGTTPTRTRGYVYCGAISVRPGIQVKAVAYRSGMADSEVATP
ncbi:MAG: FN3 associated domain-containing protein [Chthoniobacter sp.]|nr:FN3 associated domain-containing protein [Chthoniobacter sp.]